MSGFYYVILLFWNWNNFKSYLVKNKVPVILSHWHGSFVSLQLLFLSKRQYEQTLSLSHLMSLYTYRGKEHLSNCSWHTNTTLEGLPLTWSLWKTSQPVKMLSGKLDILLFGAGLEKEPYCCAELGVTTHITLFKRKREINGPENTNTWNTNFLLKNLPWAEVDFPHKYIFSFPT